MTEPGSVVERTPTPPSTIEAGAWARSAWLARFSSLFEASRPRSRAGALELGLLALIVAAGAALRFWGLGAVGLHGDEKTMALPTMHLVHFGTPLFPSGLYYARGTAQLYLMAASVEAFGASAWAFRLPSALCGILLIGLAYLAGRRFLTAPWNLAFTAAVAFLPSFIEDAQTARMYVFLVTSVAGALVLLFQWERTGRDGWLLGAAAVLAVGIQFHQLAVFAAFLLLYPGLLHADGRKLLAGLVAFGAVAACFVAVSHWIETTYPHDVGLPGVADIAEGPQAAAALTHVRVPLYALIGAVTVIAASLGVLLYRSLPRGGLGAAAAILLALVPVAQALDSGHVALILAAAGLILAGRAVSAAPAAVSGAAPRATAAHRAERNAERTAVSEAARGRLTRRIGAIALLCVAVLAVQLALLGEAGVPLRERVGLILGWPSVWPFSAISLYSRFAALAAAAGVALAGWRLARRQPVPDFFLLIALGVWIPLLMIGLFKWNIPIRYAAAQCFPLLLGGFAAARWLTAKVLTGKPRRERAAAWQVAIAAAAAVLAVGPVSFARTLSPGYQDHPDHLGAARFIQSRHLGPKDIVIAEDVIMQTYYLGHVDYWLIGPASASEFVYRRDGRYEDFYTDTPVITSASELERLIARRDRGAIYIIGSGEQQQDGRAYARGPSLARFLASPRLDVVYVGRDGLTKVWKIPAPAH